MKFTKMQGIGNDYVYINCFEEIVENPSDLAIKVSNRNFGVGSDGLILIKPSNVADFKMDMYNADGSQAKMCGNGIRCVGKYVFDKGLTSKKIVTVETLAGIKTLFLEIEDEKVSFVTVDMGQPSFKCEDVALDTIKDKMINEILVVNNIGYNVTCVSMGNPHCVIYEGDVKDIEKFNLEGVGRDFENNSFFTEGVNVEFVKVIDRKTLKMRVWERGSGETLACGTGACATVVASYVNGLCEKEVEVILRGGSLFITYVEETNTVLMKGSATIVFDGEFVEDFKN